MSAEAVGHVASVGAPSSPAALDRVLRHLQEELGSQPGPAGAGLARARAATQFATGGGDHPVGTSVPAERVARAVGECGVDAVVEEDPVGALPRAATTAEAGPPVVVSGSFHLLAAVRAGTTAR
jgi:hypothetical protein